MKVGIEVFRCKLRLRFPRALFAGSQKYLSLNLADTAENRLLAEMKAKQIELDIIAGYFDPTLAKYKREYQTAKKKKHTLYWTYGVIMFSLRVINCNSLLL